MNFNTHQCNWRNIFIFDLSPPPPPQPPSFINCSLKFNVKLQEDDHYISHYLYSHHQRLLVLKVDYFSHFIKKPDLFNFQRTLVRMKSSLSDLPGLSEDDRAVTDSWIIIFSTVCLFSHILILIM